MRSHPFHSYATLHGVIWSLTNKMQNVKVCVVSFMSRPILLHSHKSTRQLSFAQTHRALCSSPVTSFYFTSKAPGFLVVLISSSSCFQMLSQSFPLGVSCFSHLLSVRYLTQGMNQLGPVVHINDSGKTVSIYSHLQNMVVLSLCGAVIVWCCISAGGVGDIAKS